MKFQYPGQYSCFFFFFFCTHLFSHLADTLDAGAVQMTVILARFDEAMALDVFLHLFP